MEEQLFTSYFFVDEKKNYNESEVRKNITSKNKELDFFSFSKFLFDNISTR